LVTSPKSIQDEGWEIQNHEDDKDPETPFDEFKIVSDAY
jgi:hypothetical protein